MTTVAWVKTAAPVDMRPRMLGGFTARSSPNRMYDLYHPSGSIGCCNAAGVRALHMAWLYGLERRDRAVYVNLLFDRDTPFARLESGLPALGCIRVTMKTGGDLYVRIPDWARHALAYDPAEIVAGASWRGPFHRSRDLKTGQTVTLTFPLPRGQQEWYQPTMQITYRTQWLGDTVVSISPPGNCFPLYERKHLLG